MRKRFFSIYLFLVLIFLFSCNGDINQAKKELTKEERAQALKTLKSQFKGAPKKMARVDEYFEKKVKDPAQRDTLLQVFSLGAKYQKKMEDRAKNLQVEELSPESPDVFDLRREFIAELKKFNYTENDFNAAGEDFLNFVNSSEGSKDPEQQPAQQPAEQQPAAQP
ncbi:hypothetical protein [Borreliella lusitaniae]|uniref:hypothetical protein n=1 Tax=Borreliella lusitaniae TaxID=100177 RepID=UPI002648DAC8|nr:hypothetical protein [Borreliella lusitaniae]WKC84911.1 hypothetical protein QIA24_00480 [Borreliella lusitaniae]